MATARPPEDVHHNSRKVVVHLEGRLRETLDTDLALDQEQIKTLIASFLESAVVLFHPESEIDLSSHSVLYSLLYCLRVAEIEGIAPYSANEAVSFWRAETVVHLYSVYDKDTLLPTESTHDEREVASYSSTLCPCQEFEGLWEATFLEGGIKEQLLAFIETMLTFSRLGVNPNVLPVNKLILLYGPPGSGKTTLAKALCQKLAIRLSDQVMAVELITVSAQSLLSKYFGESGSKVQQLFTTVKSQVEKDPETLFVMHIDEVETIIASREKALSGTDPSDAIKVVNAVLTSMDALARLPNVFLCCTSNLATNIDVAFMDRAGMTLYIGPPSPRARYQILRNALCELIRVGLVTIGSAPSSSGVPPNLTAAIRQSTAHTAVLHDPIAALVRIARDASDGLSGRSLKALVLRAYASLLRGRAVSVPLEEMVSALEKGVEKATEARVP